MHLLKTIISIGLAVHLINCGGQGKTKDGRIVLSSQSEDNSMVMPEGTCENCIVNSQKLGVEIVKKFKSISRIYDISFDSELYIDEALATIFSFGQADNTYDNFSVSFTITTLSGADHNIECKARTSKRYLILENCGNDQVVLSKDWIHINFDNIVTDDSNNPKTLVK